MNTMCDIMRGIPVFKLSVGLCTRVCGRGGISVSTCVWVCIRICTTGKLCVCVCVFTFIRCVLYTFASELHHNTISTHTSLGFANNTSGRR